jgi:hypothetical protein
MQFILCFSHDQYIFGFVSNLTIRQVSPWPKVSTIQILDIRKIIFLKSFNFSDTNKDQQQVKKKPKKGKLVDEEELEQFEEIKCMSLINRRSEKFLIENSVSFLGCRIQCIFSLTVCSVVIST